MTDDYFLVVSGFMERRAPIVRYYRLRLCIKQTKAFQLVVYSGETRAFSHKKSIIVKKMISVILVNFTYGSNINQYSYYKAQCRRGATSLRRTSASFDRSSRSWSIESDDSRRVWLRHTL